MLFLSYVLLGLLALAYAEEKTGNVIKVEVESTAGKNVSIICNPPENITKIVWKVGDIDAGKAITDMKRFTYVTVGRFSEGALNIENVDYADRNTYNCHMEEDNATTIIKAFRLRVRDSLGPLWPTLGIVIGAIVLVIVIGTHEHMNRKPDPK